MVTFGMYERHRFLKPNKTYDAQ